jgi:hypothetical protein
MRRFEVVRFGFGQDSTIGILAEVLNGNRKRIAFTIEDERRLTKVYGETCIPTGTYELELQTSGELHEKYAARYGPRHMGMIHVKAVPGFIGIMFHPGNSDDDTKGCILPGTVPVITQDGEFKVADSQPAYWKFYDDIAPSLAAGKRCILTVTEVQPWA